jgi:hypothetical protein
MHLVDLLVALDIEGDVVKPGLVDLEGMTGKGGLGLPDVEGRAVRLVDVHGEIVLRARIVADGAHRVPEEREQRREELHGLGQIADRDGYVVDRAVQHC